METASKQELLDKIKALELENSKLRQHNTNAITQHDPQHHGNLSLEEDPQTNNQLTLEEYKRYGRQMIVPEFGSLDSQLQLKASKILVIGAGGLGCPALLYLSAAGIGEIGIVDNDTVDITNLHRQVLHTTETVGMLKCDSAKLYISKLNPHVKVTSYPVRLDNSNAFNIFQNYDLILDCTDAPAVRYLINDVAVILGKTVISGSGLKTDGQWTILNFQNKGPCYRCFHPKPPSPDSITSCQDGGVIGPAIGIIGLNMALETIKVLIGYYDTTFKPFMGAFYGFQFNQYRTFKMRNRQPKCEVCGVIPKITRNLIEENKLDYHVFCGRALPYSIDSRYRVSVDEYSKIVKANEKHILIDVRPSEQFKITALSNSINIPWDSSFLKLQSIDDYIPKDFSKTDDVCYVVCRYGNDSQIAAKTIVEKFGLKNVKDIIGGMNKWSEDVDSKVPKY